MQESKFLVREGNLYRTTTDPKMSVIVALFGLVFLATPLFIDYGKSLPMQYRILCFSFGVFMLYFAYEFRKPIAIFDKNKRIFTGKKNTFSKQQIFSFDQLHHFEISHLKGDMVKAVFREGVKETVLEVKPFGVNKEKEIQEFIDSLYELMEIPHPKETI